MEASSTTLVLTKRKHGIYVFISSHLILACQESGVAACPPHVHHGDALIEGVSDLERLGPRAISAVLPG